MLPKNHAYDALNDFFKAHENVAVEIEILPSALAPTDALILQDGINIGIPKKVLVQAYLKARTIFFLQDGSSPSKTLALEATRIILLFDPEHLTAANFRKKRLVTIQKEVTGGFTNTLTTAAQQELQFLNSILTSPLHRQSKSPTLWYHRYWLFSNILLTTTLYDPFNELYDLLVKSEFDAVFKAGEQHPKNYYAWQYARSNRAQLDVQDIVNISATRVKDWCLRHPSDTSGWSFLLFVLGCVGNLPTRKDIISNILDLTFGFRWQHESLWAFIRTALSDPSILADGQAPLVERLYGYEKERDNYTTSVSTALQWIETNKTTVP
ncbi:uncharacterized protein K441DRAFT_576677 [Cenococcum geophilum 1.58]|uniref:uncharacterized protein n=1 Tax=Cenococcum geophilum 1.58 TaxID=794803 RepID=UPI00358F7754|nr:hypothetical protein K441DRAFT_576677 [Cenococcum geophilum 1.58]